MLLLDEVDKIFKATTDDSGVSQRILSSLLWWLQEHNSKILTVLTTNDMNSLPKELYRPGRLDKIFTFLPLDFEVAIGFCECCFDSFGMKMPKNYMPSYPENTVDTSGYKFTQAELYGQVVDYIKAKKLAKFNL